MQRNNKDVGVINTKNAAKTIRILVGLPLRMQRNNNDFGVIAANKANSMMNSALFRGVFDSAIILYIIIIIYSVYPTVYIIILRNYTKIVTYKNNVNFKKIPNLFKYLNYFDSNKNFS